MMQMRGKCASDGKLWPLSNAFIFLVGNGREVARNEMHKFEKRTLDPNRNAFCSKNQFTRYANKTIFIPRNNGQSFSSKVGSYKKRAIPIKNGFPRSMHIAITRDTRLSCHNDILECCIYKRNLVWVRRKLRRWAANYKYSYAALSGFSRRKMPVQQSGKNNVAARLPNARCVITAHEWWGRCCIHHYPSMKMRFRNFTGNERWNFKKLLNFFWQRPTSPALYQLIGNFCILTTFSACCELRIGRT